ncbi:hypothetical protein BS78_01G332200 [Paspalum vaginatum]|nr:hypothetical protein BS78_01G332200 [Paspalum vaginatum]
MSMSSSSSSKRRRLNRGSQRRPRQKQHLYLALDDWNCGYSIHKLDADDIIDDNLEHRLPEPAAVRLTSTSLLTPLPHGPTMAFAAMGSKIFIDTNSHDRGARAKPSLVYDTETAALVVGPRLPAWLHDLGTAVAVGDHLYALTTPRHNGFEPEHEAEEPSLQVLSWALTAVPTFKAYDAEMEWSWEPR